MSAEYDAPTGIRVSPLVTRTHVLSGATVDDSGASGPEGRRSCTVTDSEVVPGFNTSISDDPPWVSWLCGMTQCDSGRANPVTKESPAVGAGKSWS